MAESSPCLPASNPCGALIGRSGQGCGPSAVTRASSAVIEAGYRWAERR